MGPRPPTGTCPQPADRLPACPCCRVRATEKYGHIVLLRLKDTHSLLPVYIGEFECGALVKEINKKPTVRACAAAGAMPCSQLFSGLSCQSCTYRAAGRDQGRVWVGGRSFPCEPAAQEAPYLSWRRPSPRRPDAAASLQQARTGVFIAQNVLCFSQLGFSSTIHTAKLCCLCCFWCMAPRPRPCAPPARHAEQALARPPAAIFPSGPSQSSLLALFAWHSFPCSLTTVTAPGHLLTRADCVHAPPCAPGHSPPARLAAAAADP